MVVAGFETFLCFDTVGFDITIDDDGVTDIGNHDDGTEQSVTDSTLKWDVADGVGATATLRVVIGIGLTAIGVAMAMAVPGNTMGTRTEVVAMVEDSFVLSSEWMSMCVFKLPCWVNRLLQMLHTWGFSPVWVNRCRSRLEGNANPRSHSVHLCGFAPVCVNMCVFKLPPCVNRLSQTEQAYGFSPVCVNL